MAKKATAKKTEAMFRGELAFLSNFYPAQTEYEGVVYKTSEHAFQAAKSLDPRDRDYIRSGAEASDAKRMGQAIQLRDDWNDVKIQVMRDCLKSKFTRNPALAKKLVATGDLELVETNWWGDDYWGKCTENGQNWLGKLLMELREELKNAE
jgi:ribA/ribD-fused uncharacterized protein